MKTIPTVQLSGELFLRKLLKNYKSRVTMIENGTSALPVNNFRWIGVPQLIYWVESAE